MERQYVLDTTIKTAYPVLKEEAVNILLDAVNPIKTFNQFTKEE